MSIGADGLDRIKGEHLNGEETEGELRDEAADGALVLLDGELEIGEVRETGKWPVGGWL
jgi:hypothetical protein